MADRERFTPEILRAQEKYREIFYQTVAFIGAPIFSLDEVPELMDRVSGSGGVLTIRLEYDHYSHYPYPSKVYLPRSIQSTVDATYQGVSINISEVTFWPDAVSIRVEDMEDTTSIAGKKECIKVNTEEPLYSDDAEEDNDNVQFCVGKNLLFSISPNELSTYRPRMSSLGTMVRTLSSTEIEGLAELLKSNASREITTLNVFRKRELRGL